MDFFVYWMNVFYVLLGSVGDFLVATVPETPHLIQICFSGLLCAVLTRTIYNSVVDYLAGTSADGFLRWLLLHICMRVVSSLGLLGSIQCVLHSLTHQLLVPIGQVHLKGIVSTLHL